MQHKPNWIKIININANLHPKCETRINLKCIKLDESNKHRCQTYRLKVRQEQI